MHCVIITKDLTFISWRPERWKENGQGIYTAWSNLLKKKTKTKKIWKRAIEKWHFTFRRKPIRMAVDVSWESMEARRKWHSIFQVLKEQNCQLRILYPVNISFRNEGAIRTFSDKGKQRFIISRSSCSKRMAGGSSQNKKKAIKEGMLEHMKEERT